MFHDEEAVGLQTLSITPKQCYLAGLAVGVLAMGTLGFLVLVF